MVTALLRAGAKPDVDVVSMAPKRSALYVATVCGHEEAARSLLSAGADARFEDPVDRCSVLHEAAWAGHEQLVTDLLMAGADPSRLGPAPSMGGAPLHQAAAGGHPNIVSALLLKGVDIDVPDDCGESPLMWAVDEGQLAAVEALVTAGANFNIRSTVNCFSALDCAASEGHVHILKAILAHGADVNARDDKGYTALHTAAGADQAGVVEALVEEGANVDPMISTGWTPLSFAACVSNNKALISLLQNEAVVNKRGVKKYTALHHACSGRYPGLAETVDLLLRWGADETALTTGGETAAHLLGAHTLFHEEEEPYCSDEEMGRTRLLLARAGADRTWRRRSWLIMVYSRASKTAANNENGSKCGGDSTESTARATTVRLRNPRAPQVPLYRT